MPRRPSTARFGRRVRTLLAATTACAVVFAGPGAALAQDEDAAEQAANEIAAAQDRANQAAADLFQAQLELERLAERSAQLATQTSQLETEVAALREQVEQVAVNRFTSSGSIGIPLLTSPEGPSDRLQADALVNVATNVSAVSMDEFERAQLELEEHRAEVAANEDEIARQQDLAEQLQAQAQADVVTLREAEEQRLEDERIAIELERRRREEEARRQAEADAEAQAQAQAEARRQAELAAAAATAPAVTNAIAAAPPETAAPAAADEPDATTNALPASPEPSRAAPAAPAPPPAPAPAPATPDDEPDQPDEPDEPDAPAPTAPPAPSGGGMTCPVRGGSAYSDTWGAARSGGRTHEGVDMLAGRGTTLVAATSGSVQFKQTSLGGNSVWLTGNNGTKYFYAHLDGFEGSSRSVSAGEVIGYMGASGNANGTVHLHFEVHPGGGAAVNPYPYVRNAGC